MNTQFSNPFTSENATAFFEFLRLFFSNPIDYIQQIVHSLSNFVKGDFSSIDPMKERIQLYFDQNHITIESLAMTLVFFILFYLIYKNFLLNLFNYKEAEFFRKKIMGFVYVFIWVILGLLVLVNSENWTSTLDSLNLKNSKIFLISIAISIGISILFCLVFSFFSDLMMTAIVTLLIGAALLCFKYRCIPSNTVIFFFIVFIILLFVTGILFKNHGGSFKKASYLVLRHLIPLLCFLIAISAIHYLLISTTTVIYQWPSQKFITYFFTLFMNVWAHFTSLYIVIVFVSSLFSPSTKGSFFASLKQTFNSFDIICVRALYSTLYQTFILLLDILLTVVEKYNNPVFQIIAFILRSINSILNFLLMFVVSTNTQDLIKLGYSGLEKFFEPEYQDVSFDSNESSFLKNILLSLECTPDLLISILSISSLKLYLQNSNHLFFSLFMACNLFIYFVNAFFIASRVISIKYKGLKEEEQNEKIN